ncbi:hypothetical protein [Agrococcus sp. TF02-05]|uniref:hypothetical protein n=1 Tax=Agrococcus sp. TF02-05 TaxID=2815211 RepID=UPI001AA11810|nr:hypothetical protein [Agrococcus sp. TF02-05]MBO1769325.1 hypothetical protein [Agrococcus sp. TF02-05]
MNGIDRLWSIGAALVAAGVIAGVWFGVISPDLTAASRARDDLASVEQQNGLHEIRIVALEQEATRMPEITAAREQLADGIPSDLDYTAFMRQVQGYAAEAGVVLTGMSTVDAVPYVPPAADPSAQQAAPPAEGEAAEGEADAQAAAPTGDPAADAPMPYTDPLIGEHNLAVAQFAVKAEGERARLADFLHRLQMGSRIVSISAAAFEPNQEDEALQTVEITGSLYALQAGAVPAP